MLQNINAKGNFLNAVEPSIEATIALMEQLHEGQVDHAGKEYKHHPLRVANNLRRLFPNVSDDVVKAALLHDVVEDCGVTAEFLQNKGYSADCIAMVYLVTKPDGDARPYDQVITDLIASGNKGAMMIKVADNMDNLHPERQEQLRQINPEKADRLRQKYLHSIERLSDALGLDFQQVLQQIKNSPKIEATSDNVY